MVGQCSGGYWAITHFNLFIADIPLTGHMHTPEKHEPSQKQSHHVTVDGSDLERKRKKNINVKKQSDPGSVCCGHFNLHTHKQRRDAFRKQDLGHKELFTTIIRFRF